MKTKLALAIASITLSCGAFAAGSGTIPNAAWSGRQFAINQARQLAKGPGYTKYWANEQSSPSVPSVSNAPYAQDIAAEIGSNSGNALKAMREGSTQDMQASAQQPKADLHYGHDPIGVPATKMQAETTREIADNAAGAPKTVREQTMQRKLPVSPAQRDELAKGTGAKAVLSHRIE